MASNSRLYALCLTLILALDVSAATAATIRVPADQPTIQAGINAANNGDTVLVSPGTYTENINFLGKQITVTSSGGASVTVIDGGGVTSVVRFSTNETLSSVLSGFTLQNGNALNAPELEGGGIAIENASPTIKDNIIQNNLGGTAGGGIGINSASPLISGNVIKNNSQNPGVDSGVGGGGISVRGAGSAQIIGNVILKNSWSNAGTGFGGGISLSNSVSTLIQNNLIEGNVAGTQGAGICMEGDVSGTVIVQNVIVGNSSPTDAGVYWFSSPAVFVNNTLSDSRAISTSTVIALIPNTTVVIANNLIVASDGATYAFTCGFNDFQNPQNFYNNDIFSGKGTAYFGCTDQTGANGNISSIPSFVGKGNFRLMGGSAGIDAGNNSAPDLPSTDFAGNLRIINGNGGPTAIVDMGAYEFIPVTLTPKSLNFGTQAVGSTTTKTVTLTNAQNKSLNISSKTVPTGYAVSGCGTSVAAFSSCSLTVTFQPLTSGTFKGILSVKDSAGNSPQNVNLFGKGQ